MSDIAFIVIVLVLFLVVPFALGKMLDLLDAVAGDDDEEARKP
jgi:hypothetical protein